MTVDVNDDNGVNNLYRRPRLKPDNYVGAWWTRRKPVEPTRPKAMWGPAQARVIGVDKLLACKADLEARVKRQDEVIANLMALTDRQALDAQPLRVELTLAKAALAPIQGERDRLYRGWTAANKRAERCRDALREALAALADDGEEDA